MIGLWVAVGIIGILVFSVGIAVASIGMFEALDGEDWFGLFAGVFLVVLGVALAAGGFSEAMDIERQQCEAAGCEWITGECYGSNVNVNR